MLLRSPPDPNGQFYVPEQPFLLTGRVGKIKQLRTNRELNLGRPALSNVLFQVISTNEQLFKIFKRQLSPT
jgi:hypothetical protein